MIGRAFESILEWFCPCGRGFRRQDFGSIHADFRPDDDCRRRCHPQRRGQHTGGHKDLMEWLFTPTATEDFVALLTGSRAAGQGANLGIGVFGGFAAAGTLTQAPGSDPARGVFRSRSRENLPIEAG